MTSFVYGFRGGAWKDRALKRIVTRQQKRAHAASEDFEFEIAMDLTQLADYLTTQSNVIQSLLEERASLEEVLTWLQEELQPFYANKTPQEILFGCKMTYYQLEAE